MRVAIWIPQGNYVGGFSLLYPSPSPYFSVSQSHSVEWVQIGNWTQPSVENGANRTKTKSMYSLLAVKTASFPCFNTKTVEQNVANWHFVGVFETNWRDFQEIIFYSLKMIITAKLLMNIYRWFMRSMLLYNTLKGKKHWNLLTKIVFNLKIILSQKNFFDRSHFSGLWIIFQN